MNTPSPADAIKVALEIEATLNAYIEETGPDILLEQLTPDPEGHRSRLCEITYLNIGLITISNKLLKKAAVPDFVQNVEINTGYPLPVTIEDFKFIARLIGGHVRTIGGAAQKVPENIWLENDDPFLTYYVLEGAGGKIGPHDASSRVKLASLRMGHRMPDAKPKFYTIDI